MVDRPRLAGIDALHALGADAALETAACLDYRLFLCEALLDLGEIGPPRGRVEMNHLLAGNRCELPLRHARGLLFGFFPSLFEIHSFQIATNRFGRLVPLRHRLHGRSRTQNRVPPGKQAGGTGLQRHRVHLESPSRCRARGTVPPQKIKIRSLSDGRDHRIGLDDEFRSLHRDRSPPPRLVRLPQLHAHALQPFYPPVLIAEDTRRSGQVEKLDPLFFGEPEFFLSGRNLLPGTAVHDRHFGTQTERRPGAVHRHIPTADDQHLLSHVRIETKVRIAQKLDALQRALQLLSLDLQQQAAMGSNRQKDRLVALLLEILQAPSRSDRRVQLQLDAQGQDVVDLLFQHIFGQPVVRYAQPQHPPRLGRRLEDRHLAPLLGKVKGRGEAGRPRTHDCHLLPILWRDKRQIWPGAFLFSPLALVVACKPLQRVDRHRLVDLPAVTRRLTGVVADAAAHRGQGMPLPDQGNCLPELPLGDQGRIALAVHSGRAGRPTGRRISLVDAVDIGDRLRIEFVDDLARTQPLVELVRQLHRTDRLAVPAGIALYRIYKSGRLQQRKLEVPRLSRNRDQLGVGDNIDIGMFVALHQPGGDRAHRTVVGGKGLVELGHAPADTARPLDQVDLEPGLGQIQRGLHPGDAAA